MNIPKKFFIRGKPWLVRRKKSLKNDEGEKCYGLTDVDKNIVYLDSSLVGSSLEYVFCHEYAHALLWECGATVHDGGVSSFVEDIICDAIAYALTEHVTISFKENKK
jgi:Zn-dependent peptidase ImmA (M78 family)